VSHPVALRLASDDPAERVQACHDARSDPSAVLLVDALLEALGDPIRAVSQAASDALADLGRDHDVLGPLRRALHDGDDRRRLAAALTLARLGPPDVRLLPALVAGLGLEDGKRRWWALRLLVETGRLHGETLPLLVGLARSDPNPVVRRMARHGLRELGRDDPTAAAALLGGTADEDVVARRAAYAALCSQLDPAPEVLAHLARALTDEPDPACRRIASVALGEIGSRTLDTLPASVRAALENARDTTNDPDLRRGAERALARLDPSPPLARES